MGNDIARQFAHLPDDEAADAVSRHIETFWDPAMRDRLRALARTESGSLDPVLLTAAGRVKDGVTRRETAAQPE